MNSPVPEVMSKWKSGTLKSGGNGAPIKSRRQAIAVMLSEKRKADEGDKEYQPSKSENAVRAAVGRKRG